ncbi:MAG: membrane protein insertion efficiency factor YidD [Crocinitomicaceae bacterium]|nr:membrane protein insertion efficiency factor YidD [Crocinitomicaceae bacterium]MDG1735582.1 membrane protein insertion efficiency factor YidD [Crocinitomicaceae bacterium]MDG2504826.1 membrane protein insertion efficiency factor YidD [Crocinitomicaceae bacterium]
MKQILIFPFIFLVRLYQWLISPLFPATCRFTPSCSAYTIQALKEWGLFKGVYLSIKRILSCRPGCKHGHDPVPKRID